MLSNVGSECHEIGSRGDGTVSRNHDVEIEREHLVQRLGPFERAPAFAVIHVDVRAARPLRDDRPAEKQIARVDGSRLWKIDHRVAARVTAPVVARTDLLPAEVHVGLF